MPLEEALVHHCAPTLAALKPASLFRYLPRAEENPVQQLREWNALLSARGLRIMPLKRCRAPEGYLLYVYRRAELKRRLNEPEMQEFLAREGYTLSDDCERMLTQLSRRLRSGTEFPHEIGVFLGYPMEDIVGFIENGGKNYRYCGCWKVYGDVAGAKQLFAQYKKCTQIFTASYARGDSALALTARTERKDELS